MLPSSLEFFPALSIAYALSIYAAMFGCSALLLRFDRFDRLATPQRHRSGCLDGLRGVLASGVLTHHSFTAYVYFTRGAWQWSSSAVLNQLGQTTVALFFMITGFLFTRRVLVPPVRWKSFYIGRLARLMPLYGLVVGVVFAFALGRSGGVLNESRLDIARELALWLTCASTPDVNAYPMTWTMIAGVNWSLKYELLFYLLGVPAVSWVVARSGSPARAGIVLATAAAILLLYRSSVQPGGGPTLHVTRFLCGGLAACALTVPSVREWAASSAFRWTGALAIVPLLAMNDANGSLALLCTLLSFVAVATGASFLGLLRTRAAVWLGDVSYGVYLLHGLVLWTCLRAGQRALDAMDLRWYWLGMLFLSAAVVALASLSYAWVERRVLDRVQR